MIRFHPILTVLIVSVFVCLFAWQAAACDDVECPELWVWSDAEGTCIKQFGEVSRSEGAGVPGFVAFPADHPNGSASKTFAHMRQNAHVVPWTFGQFDAKSLGRIASP